MLLPWKYLVLRNGSGSRGTADAILMSLQLKCGQAFHRLHMLWLTSSRAGVCDDPDTTKHYQPRADW